MDYTQHHFTYLRFWGFYIKVRECLMFGKHFTLFVLHCVEKKSRGRVIKTAFLASYRRMESLVDRVTRFYRGQGEEKPWRGESESS